jgi:hypothetical protein
VRLGRGWGGVNDVDLVELASYMGPRGRLVNIVAAEMMETGMGVMPATRP